MILFQQNSFEKNLILILISIQVTHRKYVNLLAYSKNSKRETAASFYQCAETINHQRKHTNPSSLSDFQPVRPSFVAVSFRPRVHRRSRRNTKTTIYDCRRSRSELISPDFTSAPSNPTDRSLRLFYFFPPRRLLFLPPPPPLPLYSRQDETERNLVRRPALPFACIAKRAVRSSITTVRTRWLRRARRKEMIDEGEDGKRERKGQEEIGGRIERRRKGRRTESGRERHGGGAFLLVGPH